MKICHLTSVHPRYDTRIFIKECQSLAQHQHQVSLIVADGLGDETKNRIAIYDVGKESSRLKRMLKSPRKILKKALLIDADAYHFHDPELLPVGAKLVRKGKKVIYDVHEDIPRQILSKPYLKIQKIKSLISALFEKYENRKARKFSHIVTATDFIKNRFLEINPNTEAVKNYPVTDELKMEIDWNKKKNQVCYIGSLSKVRGIEEMVKALRYTTHQLHIAGKFNTEQLQNEISNLPTWQNTVFHGFIGREELKKILSESKAGLVTLHPTINYKNALPVKMFEYMLAGIPVIASNIPLWEEIVIQNQCGICVNPLEPKEIADAINYLVNNNSHAREMGKNGQKAVLEKYTWQNEEKKLLSLYDHLSENK